MAKQRKELSVSQQIKKLEKCIAKHGDSDGTREAKLSELRKSLK